MKRDFVCDWDGATFAIERLGFRPDAKQRIVLDDRIRRGVLNCSRQWGKSTVSAAKAVYRAYTRPGSLVVVLSPGERQSGEFMRKAAAFTQKLGIAPRGDGGNKMSLVFPHGSRIVGLPGVHETVRGFSAVSLMLIDEASRVSDELYHAVMPMLAVSNGDLWLMSTPDGQRGFFYEEWTNGGNAWVRVSAPGWECPRISAEVLAEARTSLGENGFRQEFGCEFVDSNECVFDSATIRAAITDDVLPLDLRRR